MNVTGTTSSPEAALPAEEWLSSGPNHEVPEAQWEVIRFCVQAAQVMGLPRSSGEIFGFIFSSAQPVNFETIVSSLRISKGSASQGLRYLRRLGAIAVTYVARDRRDHFVAEKSLERVISGFLLEKVSPLLGGEGERLRLLREQTLACPSPATAHLPERLGALAAWLEQASRAVRAAAEALQPPARREEVAL